MKTFQMNNAGVSAELRLGIAGFTYSDLYKSERLKELLDVFDVEVAEANPELFAAWDDYRNYPEKPRTEPEISALLVAMAAHVSQFLTKLFGIATEVEALAAATADQNLAEMAQRLEAALRRPSAEPMAPPPVPPEPPPGRPMQRAEAPIAPPPPMPSAPKTSFENLEDEMASLLGRPKSP